MPRPVHLSSTGLGGGVSADGEVAAQLAARDLTQNLRRTLCGAQCGSHECVDDDDVVKVTDTNRRLALRPGGPENENLCSICVHIARRSGRFKWITEGAPLPSDDPKIRAMLDQIKARE